MRGENRRDVGLWLQAVPTLALAKRPFAATKPTATALVNSEVCMSSRASSNRNAGTTAVAENHSASASAIT